MGCDQDTRIDMLFMAIFCTAINDVLTKFCDEGQSSADPWIRVRGAINFLSYHPERSPEQRKKDGWDLPAYGFRGNVRELTYEQLVAARNFFKEHEKELLETKKKLPMILDLKLGKKERMAAARYCIGLFYDLASRYLHYCDCPPNFGPPKGLMDLIIQNESISASEQGA